VHLAELCGGPYDGQRRVLPDGLADSGQLLLPAGPCVSGVAWRDEEADAMPTPAWPVRYQRRLLRPAHAQNLAAGQRPWPWDWQP
jgi:hypothetical protein